MARLQATLIVCILVHLVGCSPSLEVGQSPESVLVASPTASGSDSHAPGAESSTQQHSQKVGPGWMKGKDGTPMKESGELEYTVFDTGRGTAMVGMWPSLQPKLVEFIIGNRDFYKGASVAVTDKFITITPTKKLPTDVFTETAPPVQVEPGQAFIDSKGVVHLTLSDAPLPGGFQIFGQMQIAIKILDEWKQYQPLVIQSAGDVWH